MKKVFVTLIMSLLSMLLHAQINNDSIVYKYIIAQPQGSLFSDKCKLRIDDGIDPSKAKDKGKSISFKSYAAALMYLTSQGWELVSTFSNVSGSSGAGYGATSTSNYWILRKPSTKEEVQRIVDESIKKE